jgi:hypothetical protein
MKPNPILLTILMRAVFLLIILLVIALPILHGTGGLYIGGDWMIPFYSESLDKYLHQWIELENGVYFSVNYFQLYFLYKVFDFITSDIYLKGILLLFAIRVIAATGIYKSIKLIYANEFDFKTTLIIAFYLLSPAYYNGHVYWLIYAFIPWFFYFIVKIIKNRAITYLDIIFINIIIFWSSADLPNPKYLFHYIFILFISLVVAFVSRKINFDFFLKNKFKIILALSLSTYLIIPLITFVLNYDPVNYGGVGIKKGYSNEASASLPDHGSTTANKMFRLFNDGMAMDKDLKKGYLSNPLVTLANYSFIFLITLYFLRNGIKTFHDCLLISLTITYLFFAIGPNPPFGFLYEYFITSFPLLAFLRTTAGAVFYLSLFYSLLLFAALKYFNNKYLDLLFLGFLLISAYPMINGGYYQNWSCCNPRVDKKEYGLKIPEPYFKMKSILDSIKLDAKVFTPNSNMTYIKTKWGFFGPSALYSFNYNKNFIGTDNIYSDLSKHNVGYIFMDKSLIGGKQYPINKKELRFIAQNEFIKFFGVKIGEFLPRVYAPSQLILTNNSPSYPLPISSAVLAPEDLTPDLSLKNNPTIEYKKISPTKYRIIFHKVRGDFIFVLSEKHHRLWKASISNYPEEITTYPNINGIMKKYKIFHNNENEQATLEELTTYLSKGWVTTLGYGMEKKITHYSYYGTKKNLDFTETYTIDFISKNHHGTIQNNNLKDVGMFETKRLPEGTVTHIISNIYANGWIVNKQKIEQNFPDLIVNNGDDSFDMSFVVEFSPQRIYYYSVIVSLIGIFITLVLLFFKSDKNKKILDSSF